MKTTTMLNAIWILLVSILLMSCGSAPVYKITSMEDMVDYSDGTEFVTKEDDYTATSLEFDDMNSEHIVFYVQAYNKVEEPLTFRPEDISIEYLDANMTPFYGGKKSFAVNPEKRIDQLNEELSNRETWHEAATGLNIVFGLFSVIADVADDDDEDDAFEIARDVAVFTGNQINENADYEMDKGELNAQKQFWKNEVLRTTDLGKEELIGGLVFIPFNPSANYVKLEVPIGNSIHSYLFKQMRIN